MKVGVVESTTGQIFVMNNLNMARKVVRFRSSAEMVQALIEKKIDCLVYDGVGVLMLEAANRMHGFKKIPVFLTEEYLAWGIRKDDDVLLQSANAFLEEITRNGRRKEILAQWMPNIGDLE